MEKRYVVYEHSVETENGMTSMKLSQRRLEYAKKYFQEHKDEINARRRKKKQQENDKEEA